MTQRGLLVGALALTFAVGAVFFVVNGGGINADTLLTANVPAKCSDKDYRKKNPNKCKNWKASPSPSAKSSPTPTANSSTSPDPSTTPTVSPSPTLYPSGNKLVIRQSAWKKDSNQTPINVGSLTAVDNDKNCDTEPRVNVNSFRSEQYLKKANVTIPANGEAIVGLKDKKLKDAYLISPIYTSNKSELVMWRDVKILTAKKKTGTVKLYYRISDTAGTNDPTDKGWVQLADPSSVKNDDCSDGQLASYSIDRMGKFFQYKVHVISVDKTEQKIKRLNIHLQPMSNTPPSATPTPDISGTPVAGGNGKITIITSKLVSAEESVTPTPSGPALPPSPSTQASVDPTKPNPLCFSTQDTESAPNVGISLKQTTGGKTTINDEATDDDGRWQGLNEEVDDFPVGKYVINFSDFEKSDFTLVAFCVNPDDGEHYLKTESDPANKKATIVVKAGQETKITALYGPRNKPYIAMSKFAVDKDGSSSGAQKVLKTIYPGQSFFYLIRYKNTGESDAVGVEVQDVIPEQFEIDQKVIDDVEEKYGFTFSVDVQGRTIIKKTVGAVAQGAGGAIYIPVTLKADAFDAS